ncbi:hypothetical protein COOONC_18633 [Cooperia oncophora]
MGPVAPPHDQYDIGLGVTPLNLLEEGCIMLYSQYLQHELNFPENDHFLANVWPDKHTHVPWIVVNGVSLANGQMMMDHLPYLICDWYVGDKRIPFCQYEEKAEAETSQLEILSVVFGSTDCRVVSL